MVLLNFNTSGINDGVLLVGGAGDGDTGGGIWVLDGERSETVDRVSTAGITLFEGRLARLLRTPLTTGGGEVLIYDSRGVSHYLRVDELADPHYMAWDGQHLIVSSTGTNSILWITLGGEVVRSWRAPGEDDSWHVNDVYLAGERLYACAFGRYEHYRGYKDRLSKGEGFVFDVDSGETVAAGFCAPHSPRFFDGAWTVCDSLCNSLVQVDAQGRRKREAVLRSFTRGLGVTDEYLVVGESVQRGPEGVATTGSVAVLRRTDFSFVTRYDVPFREVSDIAVVPRTLMQSLKTGFRTNPLRGSERDQLQMFQDVGIEPKRLWAVSEKLMPEQCKVRIAADIPSSFVCGRQKLVDCSVHNLSDAFLCSELPHPVFVAYRWVSTLASTTVPRDDGNRTRLPSMLPPGASIHFRMDVLAPNIEGEFELRITLLQEWVAWFDDIDASNACTAKVKVVSERVSS